MSKENISNKQQKININSDFDEPTSIMHQVLRLMELDLNFSDIFIQQDSPLLVKLPREVISVSDVPVTSGDLEEFFGSLDVDWKEKIKLRAFDKAINLTNTRIRCNCFTYHGRSKYGAVIRRFPGEPPAIETLGLRQNALAFTKLTQGLVLIIGDTCQGKSTTISSMVDEINKTRPGHIVMIEDPIELIVPQRKCIITQREVGPTGDVESFYLGALDALRERPDVIVIGEIRDEECAREAVALAESGPLVFASLHAKSIELGLFKLLRLLGGSPAQAQAMANTIKGVVCQALIPSIHGELHYLASECLTSTSEVAKLISDRDFNSIRPLMAKMSKEKCHTLNEDVQRLFKDGKISAEDAMRASNDNTYTGK
ncbi:MAG: ATPase, T2SS/T4P/T4SS family [bacterium]|nr:ATPase, T2SS/T4P/T4SS family [bacterium]